MWFTRLSIQRPIFVVVLMLTVFILGVRSKSGMNIDLNPPVNFPYVTITTTYAGTSSEEMETLVTKPIEDAVSSANGIQHITSSSQYGTSFVSIEFDLGIDPFTAESDVREKVDAARKSLPTDVDPPSISRLDLSALPVIYFGMDSALSPKQMRFEATQIVQPLFSQVAGVARVDVAGGDIREIQVDVDRGRLAAYGLSITDIVNALQAANVNVPAGHITEGNFDFDARVLGEFTSVGQIKQLRIPVPSKDPNNPLWISLSDIATVKDTVAERDNIVRIWSADKAGKLRATNAVGVIVTKDSDANTVQVVDGVRQVAAQLEKTLPGNTHFVVASDTSKQVRDSLRDVNFSLWVGALLAVTVVFLFLHELKGTAICAVAIPLSIIGTFIPMFFAGFTLNNITMLGLSLVVGILVDDSIVVLESIYRHLHRGELAAEAAYNGRSEIGLAAITITMCDVVVFLPMAFMGGIVGQFFKEFGITVACATLFSLMVSFSVTPMLASRLYRLSPEIETPKNALAQGFERGYHKLEQWYHGLLGWALHHRWTVILLGFVALVVVTVVLGPRMAVEFAPTTDQGQIIVTCEMPTGTSLDATNAVMKQIEQRVATIPQVSTIFVNVGSITGGSVTGSQLGPQYGQLSVGLMDKISPLDYLNPFYHGKGRRVTDQQLTVKIRKLLADIPGPRIIAIPVSGMGGATAPIDIELLGFDLNRMDALANRIKDRIAQIPGALSPDVSLRPGKPEADVIVDRARASMLGLSVAQIGMAVHAAYAGDTTVKYRDQGDQFDIRVQLRDRDRANIPGIESLIVSSHSAGVGTAAQPIYLRDVASVVMGSGPTEVDRLDRQRVVHVTAYLAPGVAVGNLKNEVVKAIQDIPLGDIQLKWGGQVEMMQREFGYMFTSFGLSILLVYLLMAALFDNMLYPLAIQLSLPMAIVGAVVGLVITHKTLSIISMIGMIMLIGLVQKNSILLVDYTNTLRARGVERNDAIQNAGVTRLRPILMTSVAMIFGMSPTALGIGTASESRSPMAVCVIFGLIVSTMLSLVIVPCAYSIADDFIKWLGRLFRLNEQATRTRVHRA
jgi:HAE1 family hydrophobic/amphiphilic exporter-1